MRRHCLPPPAPGVDCWEAMTSWVGPYDVTWYRPKTSGSSSPVELVPRTFTKYTAGSVLTLFIATYLLAVCLATTSSSGYVCQMVRWSNESKLIRSGKVSRCTLKSTQASMRMGDISRTHDISRLARHFYRGTTLSCVIYGGDNNF